VIAGTMKKLILVFAFIHSVFASEKLEVLNIDPETRTYLFEKAQRYSGLFSANETMLPPLYSVSKKQMGKIVCPERPFDCDKLAAVFDDIGYRILILDSFDISSNFKPFDYSFLIHEIIHALQFYERGPEIFKDCQEIYLTEEQAYRAQDHYLKDEGEFFRASMALKFFYCDEVEAAKDYQESLNHWLKKNK
jgi:hypothetical protein